MHSFHDATGALPYASRNRNANGGTTADGGQRNTWVPQLWPYVEQAALTDGYNLEENFTKNSPVANASRTKVRLSLYTCPSDPNAGAVNPGVSSPAVNRVRGNYAVNWGPVEYHKARDTPAAVAPFGFRNFVSENQPRQSKFTDFTDGTSNTLLMSESLQFPGAEVNDLRGDLFNDQGNSMFMTIIPPNSPQPDTIRYPYCTSRPEMGLPCSPLGTGGQPTLPDTTTDRLYYFAARSKHTGGVNALLGDGSVRFYSDQIIPATWKELSTMQGGNPVPSDGL
jgi:prepilin-type processing-associated H-X9-DG protein